VEAGFVSSLLSAFDPRERQGRRNLAGGAAAIGVGALTEGVGFLPALATIGAAGGGGALAESGEQVAHGETFDPSAVAGAGLQQAGQEALGQTVMWPLRALGKRIIGSSVASRAGTALDEGLQALKSRLSSRPPAVTPAETGRLIEGVMEGPVKTVKETLGAEVEKAAATGPTLPTAPLKARLAEVAEQITPMASHETVAPEVIGGRHLSGPEVQAFYESRGLDLPTQLLLPPEHPLPGVLARVRTALGDAEEMSFEDAHKIKRLLDDAVNWDSPARKQVQQITKGVRQTLRQQMASHAPYNEATEAYGKVAKLYAGSLAPQLHRDLLKNPELVVKKLAWSNPSQAQLLKDLTTTTAAAGGGGAEGSAAWDALRASWTHEKLIARGLEGMDREMQKMEASGSGQEFIRTLYGDPAGQTVWGNLKQIAQAYEAKKAEALAFEESSLTKLPSLTTTLSDLLRVGIHPTASYGLTSTARLATQTAKLSDLVQWAIYSPARTQLFVRALASPAPALALADLVRSSGLLGSGEAEGARPVPSHETTPPPKPTAVR
jgi:hypothetical protein